MVHFPDEVASLGRRGASLEPLPSLSWGWSEGCSGEAGGAAARRRAGHTLRSGYRYSMVRGPSQVPGPRQPLLPGWQRLSRAWKGNRVSPARRSPFVNKHWGGRCLPRSRWLRSCPPRRSLPLSAAMRCGCGCGGCGCGSLWRRPVPEAQGIRPTSSRSLGMARERLSRGALECSFKFLMCINSFNYIKNL